MVLFEAGELQEAEAQPNGSVEGLALLMALHGPDPARPFSAWVELRVAGASA